MNYFQMILMISLFASPAAQASEILYRANCIFYANLDDFKNGPTFSKKVELGDKGVQVVGENAGRIFEVSAFDLTSESDLRPRRQILLAAREVKSQKVLAGSGAVFSETMPESVSMQVDGSYFYCNTH